MSKGTTIFLSGMLLIIVPSMGIPLVWKHIILFAVGVLLLGIGYSLRRQQYLSTLSVDDNVRTAETFVETTDSLFESTR